MKFNIKKMKKNLIVMLLLFGFVISGCGTANDEDADVDYSDTTYRKVVLEGSINIGIDTSKLDFAENQGMVMCLPTGNFKMQFYFPVDGGAPVKQDNTISLTSYNCGAYGTADNPCTNEPVASAYDPKPFIVDEVSLEVDQDVSALIGVDEPMDILRFRKAVNPILDGVEDLIDVSVTCNMGVSNLSTPGVFLQLLSPFLDTSWMLEVSAGESESMEVVDSIIPAVLTQLKT